MTWSYQMDFRTVKEQNAAMRKIKDASIRKKRYVLYIRIFIAAGAAAFLFPLFYGNFDFRFSLVLLVILFPLMLFFIRNQSRKRFLKTQLPARYCLTLKDGTLLEELTARNGSVSSGEKSLWEVQEIAPFERGLLIRFSGPAFIFLPEAAFRRISPRESAELLLDAVAAYKNEAPERERSLPREEEDFPEYGTLYFDLPASHIYRLYMSSILHMYRNPFRYLRSAFQNAGKAFIFPGILFLVGVMLEPGILIPAVLFLLLLTVFSYAVNLLLVVWKYYLLEKKNSLEAHCGPQHISLYENRLVLRRTKNSFQCFYNAFYNVYETKESFYLLQKNPASVLVIPKWAFDSPREETLFIRTLREKILKAQKDKR